MNTNDYIIKTRAKGVKLLTIIALRLKLFSLQPLLDAKDEYYYLTDSLQL
jgi:hypothetical protein